jgi:hypothetical protein
MSENTTTANDHASDPYTDGELATMLRDCYQNHGTVTVDVFSQDPRYPPAMTVINRFGTWKSALREVEIDANVTYHQYTDDQIVSHLRQLHRKYGDVTPGLLNHEDDLVPPIVVIDVFGSWDNALRQSGLEAE